MSKIPGFGLLLALLTALPVSADVNVLYGDIDGFGFTDVAGLTDDLGAPADRNMNGILDAGDTLPSLGTAPGIGVGPGEDDFFDNHTPADPSLTDVGLHVNTLLDIEFDYAIPEGHIVSGATVTIVAGDLSLENAPLHVVIIDGQSTGQTLTPRVRDGEITVSNIVIDESLFDNLTDGLLTVTLAFDVASDDIAIDYAQLHITTRPEAISAPFLPLLLD